MSQNEFNELSDEINEEETNNEDDWEELKFDANYEICKTYPHQLRKKTTRNILKEGYDKDGYITININRNKRQKHRLIALQWLENDDPEHKTQIDHINAIRTDNRIENLRFVSPSQNQKNKVGHKELKYNYFDKLPESAEKLDSYNGHDFDGLYIDYENEKLYWFNGVRYRELTLYRNKGCLYYKTYDIENKRITLAHKVLFE